MKKWVFLFNELLQAEAYVGGSWDAVRGLLGGKGANLAEMARIGLPVPPFFTVTTEACNAFSVVGKKFPADMWDQEVSALKEIEKATGKKFGDTSNPLLVSCRSGAKFSMPGMMDTVLNIGLNDETVKGIAELTENERFAYDSYRRLIQMFGSVILGIADEAFEDPLEVYKHQKGFKSDTELTADDLKALVETFKQVVKQQNGFDFPQDPIEQLKLATQAVFSSWMGKRAIDYRRAENIPDNLGTAVNIVTMVFGNMGWDSGTGVAFTRNPATGERKIYGEYLLNAQGEDVVAGIRNTEPVERLKEVMPEAYGQIFKAFNLLEAHFHDMQDVEFTLEKGKVWVLQTRNGKRTASAAIRMAVEMVDEGLIRADEAIMRIIPKYIDVAHKGSYGIARAGVVDIPAKLEDTKAHVQEQEKPFAKGINASPGIAVGQVVFSPDLAEIWAREGKDVIMVRPSTKPDDVHGMLAAEGTLTSEGGATSHAAVVARQFGKPCIVGASSLRIDLNRKLMIVENYTVNEGDYLTIDGSTGNIYLGKREVIYIGSEEVYTVRLLDWADEICASARVGTSHTRFEVWANADYPKEIRMARQSKAKGIGLLRTEKMFFQPNCLPDVQRLVLAENETDRRKAISSLLPKQREFFDEVFQAAEALPVIVRLLDPPLCEFLPNADDLHEQAIKQQMLDSENHVNIPQQIYKRIKELADTNPILGWRGARVGILIPEIYKMQVRAILEAACNQALRGTDVDPQILIPMISHSKEMEVLKRGLEAVVRSVIREKGIAVKCSFGVMVETPRAALIANELANYADFFSFGTNDLTQIVFGYARDDAERNYLIKYVEEGILAKDPFQALDREGVGVFMKLALKEGRLLREDLKAGICGEHGGDPESIQFCYQIGMDYVSCVPERVKIARLAAAQAVIKNGLKGQL